MSQYWFKPKRYGYGATPITWEGWVFTLLTVAVILGSGWLLLGAGAPRGTTTVWVWWVIVIVVLVASVAVTRAKTEGAWRWRWGRD
jgi:hypothetical protein